MRKALAAALFLLFAATAEAADSNKFISDSSVTFSVQPKLQDYTPDDTVAVHVYPEKYQNVFHQRLSDIQRDVPLSYNEAVQNFINIYLGRKDQMSRMLGLSEYYFPIFEKAFIEKGIPEEIKYLAIVESALDPHAVSRVGATGPWQFMYSTAKAFGLTIDSYVDERKDPIAASYAAANYFRDAYNEFGDWLLAIAAYNCGKGNVNRAIKLAGGVNDYWAIWNYLPKETRNYVPAFIATTYVMKYHKQHGISRRPAGFSVYTDTVGVNKYVSLSSIAKATGIDMQQLRVLNPSYKKQIINGTAVEPKRLIIPQVGGNNFASLYNALHLIREDESLKAYGVRTDPEWEGLHKVQQDETLASIATYYNVEVQELRDWNNLESLTVFPGQTLRLEPEEKFIIYKVQAGDTLYDISRKFQGTTAAEIQQLNGLRSETLQPGMTLRINKS